MTDHETQVELLKQYSTKQEKFVYYFIALSVASIGFTITQTINQKLECIHIFLGLALVFWGSSIYCGVTFISIQLEIMYDNNRYFEMLAGRSSFPDLQNKPAGLIKAVAEKLLIEQRNTASQKSSKNFTWLQNSFYLGIVFFIIWQVIHMANN